MKKIIIIAIHIFFVKELILAQSFDCINSNIYTCAFENFIINAIKKNEIKSNFVYLEHSNFITDGIPEKILDTKILKVEHKQIRKLAKKRNMLILFSIRPVRLQNKNLVLSIIAFNVKIKNNTLEYINSGGVNYMLSKNIINDIWELTDSP